MFLIQTVGLVTNVPSHHYKPLLKPEAISVFHLCTTDQGCFVAADTFGV